MVDAVKFWDRHAPGYAKRPVADEAAYQKKLELTREHFRSDSRVLELGCGTGTTAVAHAPYAGHILATDLSPGMLDIARKKAADAGCSNVEFRVATVESFVEPEGSFDVVMTHSLLHLLEDKEAALNKIHGLLKPGGVFVSSTMCLGEKHKWFKWVGPIGKALGLIPVVKVFTASELTESIRSAGFTVETEWQPGPKQALFVIARK